MASIEINPDKMAADQDMSVTEEGIITILLQSQRILAAVINACKKMPRQIQELLAIVRSRVGAKFPEHQMAAVGGFFFLRYVCPSIMAPHAYGLLPAPPSSTLQKQLVMIAKVLQNLSNNTLPGHKEEFMARLNDFVTNNQSTIADYYADLLEAPADAYTSAPTNIVGNVQANSMAGLIIYLRDHMKKLKNVLSPEKFSELESLLVNDNDS